VEQLDIKLTTGHAGGAAHAPAAGR
jgi:hypothetical protein